MATCKECIHHDVCQAFSGGIPREKLMGDRADTKCGHFYPILFLCRRVLHNGKEIAAKKIVSLVTSACKELNLSPTTLAKWRPCFVLDKDGNMIPNGFMCTACGGRSTSKISACRECGSVSHGIDRNIYIAVGDQNEREEK